MLKIKIAKCSKCPGQYFNYNANIHNYDKQCKLDQMLNGCFRNLPTSTRELAGDSGHIDIIEPEIPLWCPLYSDGGVEIGLEAGLEGNK